MGASGLHAHSSAVAGTVRDVRARWRLRNALRGAAIVIGTVFVLLAASAFLLQALGYSRSVLLFLRMLAAAAIAVLGWRFVMRALFARPGDERVALYVEEHEPSLHGVLITAVDLERDARDSQERPGALAERVFRAVADALRRMGGGRRIETAGLLRTWATFLAVVATALTVTALGPGALRHGLQLLLTPWDTAQPLNLYSIEVKPGNTTIARGGDQLVTGVLRGFQAERVELLVRTADTAAWTRLVMTPDSVGRHAFRLFDVVLPTQYALEADGVRTPVYRLDVAELPYVRRLDLEYRFPAYTQLPPQQVDSTGDIAALNGTMVRVRVTPTVPAAGGRVVVDAGDTLQLAPTSDGSLVAVLRVGRPGFYRVELQGSDGRMLTGSLEYTIDVLPDRPPNVRFARPGRDVKVLSVDEVFAEAHAEDDYGVAKLDLVYAVNGGEERSIPLHAATRVIKDIAAGHTFMLEDERLQAGDVVAYYARAGDNNAVDGPQSATTDIYFLQVRPYAQDYRQSQQGGGGGGGGGQQQDSPNQLSERQREIIAATFNIARDSASTEQKAFEENLSTLRLSQQRLREQVDDLGRRLVDRGIAATDSGFARIAAILPQAAAAMDSAERKLALAAPRAALSSEQRALQQLQRAEAVFREIQVSMGGEGGGGGGGGGGGANASDLADIFELRREGMRNQYESVQRGEEDPQRAADAQVDETLERLKQLAARQQQEDERARRKADSLSRMGASGAQGGSAQRQLAQEAEQAARQLERLARERQSQPLADAARRLQDAADAMRRAAANAQRNAGRSGDALEKLEDARRLLDQERDGRMERDLDDAARTARELAAQEQRVAGDVARLPEAGTGRPALQRSLTERKESMADELAELTGRLERMALEHGRAKPGASRAVGQAVDTIRARRTEDKVRASQNLIGNAPQQYLNTLERSIAGDLDDLTRRLEGAAATSSAEEGKEKAGQAALDRMRALVRGMESVDERMRQHQELAEGQRRQGLRGPQGAEGQQGQPGQEGQQGQQGQQGGQSGGGRLGSAPQGSGGTGARGGGYGQGTMRDGTRPFALDDNLAREMRQRLDDAASLRAELVQQGVDVSPLDRAVDAMRGVAPADRGGDPRAAAALRAQVIDGLKAYEFALRRAIAGAEPSPLLLDRIGDVPAAFRAWVEEYYRSISRSEPR